MTIESIIIFLSILFILVVVHEFGHFLFAKLTGMRVDEFAFGFPPRLLSKKYGETTYSFNLIPLGGYVKIFGENGLEEEELKNLSHHDRNRLFSSKSPLKRILVLSGGVIFNIFAAIIFFTGAFIHGSNVFLTQDELADIPFQNRKLEVVDINEKSPLNGTGVQTGDVILSMTSENSTISMQDLNSFSATQFVQDHNNSIINISYSKPDGSIAIASVVPKAGIVDGKKILGAKFADSTFKKYTLFPALGEATKMTYEQLKYIFISLGDLVNSLIFRGAKVEDSLSGPVGLAMLTSKVASRGVDQIFFFAALLSLSLAVFNILPIPALDGGRILFVALEVVFRKKIKVQVEQLFHGLGFLALIFLMVFVTYFDIVKAFAG